MKLNEMAEGIVATRESKGFYTPSTIAPVPCPVPQTEADVMLGKL